jgi:hypothetical protein
MPAATGEAACLAGLRAGRGRGSAVSGPDDGVADAVCRTVRWAWPMAAGGTADRLPYAVRSTAAIAPPAMIAATTTRAVTPVRKLISSSQAYTAARILPPPRRVA